METVQFSADPDELWIKAAQLIDAGRINVAKPLLAAVSAMMPNSSEVILTAARLQAKVGAWSQAMRDLDGGITADPTHCGLRKLRADLRQRIGDFEGAVRDAAEAVINQPGDLDAKAILGVTLLDLGITANAIACLREAVNGAPNEPYYREALATAFEKSGQPDLALQCLTEGIANCPGSVPLRNAAILLSIRRRDFVRAVRLGNDARVAGVADACTHGLIGHALSNLQEHEEAARAYQDALKLGPEDPYVRHLVVASGALPDARRAPDEYIRTVFDGYADRFESHLLELRYGIPAAIRAILLNHPKIITGQPLGPVLDLGCGTGLVATALSDLPIESITGVDLSSRMLAHANAKGLYAELRESEIVADLQAHDKQWPIIIAADVLCYLGALDELLAHVHRRLDMGGWFIFSVEQLLPDIDGIVPGNGSWALQCQGRYAHAEQYIYEAANAAGFRILQVDRPPIRQEAGVDVPGLLLTVERIRHDG